MKRVKRNAMTLKIVVPLFLCFLIIGCGLPIYLYSQMSKSVMQRFYDGKKIDLIQMRSGLDQQTKIIESGFTTYGTTTSFDHIVNSSLSEADFSRFQEVREDLSYLMMLSDVADQSKLSLVSLSKHWAIEDGRLEQLSHQQLGQYRDKLAANVNHIIWQRQGQNLVMQVALPIDRSYTDALGIVVLPPAAIKSVLGSKMNGLSIYNQKAWIYGKKVPAAVSQLVDRQADELKIGQTKAVTVQGQPYLLSKSAYNNWIYTYRLDLSQPHTMLLQIGILLAITVVAVIGIVGLLVYRYAAGFMKPLASIREALAIEPSWHANDLELVEQNIGQIQANNAYLKAHLDSQRSQLETLFMLSLFDGRLSKEDIKARAAQFHYPIDGQSLYCVVIRTKDISFHVNPERQLFLLAISNIIAESIPRAQRMYPIVLSEDLQATIVAGTRKDVEQWYQTVQQKVKEFLKLSIDIGVSGRFDDAIDAKTALEEGKDALYRQQAAPQAINFYEDGAGQSEIEPLKYPIDLQNELFEALRVGDERAKDVLHRLVSAIFEQNHSAVSVDTALMRFIAESFQFAQVMGINNGDIRLHRQIYVMALRRQEPAQIEQLLNKQLLGPIMALRQHADDGADHNLATKIADIVHSEYDRDLTLEDIGQRLHYNSRYLGRVFKRQFGINFGEYVQQYRLKVAQTLLQDTDMPVSKISATLQYQNPQNFIRFFKKHLNMTPTEYRQQYRDIAY